MRFSKGEGGAGGRREKRRQSRERAREARRRREELERRAAAMQAPAPENPARPESKKAAESDRKEKPALGKKLEPKKDASAKGKRPIAKPAKKRAGRPSGLRELPGEIGRRLALAKLAGLLSPALRVLVRVGRLAALLVLTLAARIDRGGRWLVRLVGPPISKAIAGLGRLVTPTRAAMAIVVAAGLAALASQVLDYRAVAIGGAAYADVASLAQAPLAEHRTPWAVHGPLVGLLTIVAAVASVMTLRGAGRRALFSALGATGAGLAVVLAIDLTQAGDLGKAAAEYAGTEAVLLEGFYIQLCALLLLGFTALLPSLWKRKVS